MPSLNTNPVVQRKKLLFEYFVFKLENYKATRRETMPPLTKLRLQKLLFLLSTVGLADNRCELLDVFDSFYALPYGPVELTIYEAMKANNFLQIGFNGNNCDVHKLKESNFNSLKAADKDLIDASFASLMDKRDDYLTMPVFELVEITHQWTVWQVAMSVAELAGGRSEPMSKQEISDSVVKAF